jgi:hypothetical protein
MNKSVVAGVIAAAAVFAGVIYLERGPAQRSSFDDAPAKAAATPEEAEKAPTPTGPGLVSSSTPPPRPAAVDPRLAALMVSPNNAQIEYFSDPEGRVIKEIDKDPNSPGFGRSLREYTYAGKQVIRLVTYHYLGNQLQVVTADVVYRADGSVDQFRESTRYEDDKKTGPTD